VTKSRNCALTTACALVVLGLLAGACNKTQQSGGSSGAKTRLSIATGGTGGVFYPYGGGIAKIISEHLPNVEATAEVTAASVDNLKFLRDRKADLAFTTADTLADAIQGTGSFQGSKLPIRTIAALYKNYTQILTLASGPIKELRDLKGKVVSTGSAGSGAEVTAYRVLEAVGINPAADIRKQSLSAAQSVDALKDGKVDAFFWSGGLPTAAILDLAHTPGIRIRMISNDSVLETLKKTYGESLYVRGVIPQATYPGLEADVAVVSIPNFLVAHEAMDEKIVHDITRALFDHQAELVAIHPEARNLALQSAVEGSPAPFHPGSIRYYQEQNVWPR
jgi:TRAP transporter TAXI family solute receptor